MESLCLEDQEEKAVTFCACKFPIPTFCEKHAEEHIKKAIGFHFTLPLSAYQVITSKQVLLQAQDWLIRLSRNYDTLRERVEDFSQIEEHAEAAYQEIVQLAIDVKSKFRQELAVVKEELRAAVSQAINDTRIHALETQSFVPTNSLSQLLWYYDPMYISTCQLYEIQSSAEEHFSRVFQIAVSFTIPGFEHLKAGQYLQPPGEREEGLLKDMKTKDESHLHEVNELRRKLEVAVDNCMESERKNRVLEDRIQDLEKLLESANRELDALRLQLRPEKQRVAVMQKEGREEENKLSEMLALVTRKNTALEKEVVELNQKLQDLEIRLQVVLQELVARDQSHSALQHENERLTHLANNQFAQLEIEDREDPPRSESESIGTISVSSKLLKTCLYCACIIDIDNPQEVFAMEGCTHVFHTECIEDYVNFKLTSEQVSEILKCPCDDCPGQVGDFEHLVSREHWDMYNVMLIKAKYKIVKCPKCLEFYDVEGECSSAVCPQCYFEFCLKCMEGSHEGRCDKAYIRLRIREMEESGERVSQCPGCKLPYMNYGHCEHVKCTNPECRVEFCFTCSCLRKPTMAHFNLWHRPDCPWYSEAGVETEKFRKDCPECVRLGKRCDPPKKLRVKCRFDDDEV